MENLSILFLRFIKKESIAAVFEELFKSFNPLFEILPKSPKASGTTAHVFQSSF